MPAVPWPASGSGVPALLSPPPVCRVCQAGGHLPLVWHRRQGDVKTHHRLVTQPWHRHQGRIVDVRSVLAARLPTAQRRDATAGQQHKGGLLCLSRPQKLWDAQDPRHGEVVEELHSLSGIFYCGALWPGRLLQHFIPSEFLPQHLQVQALWLKLCFKGFPYNEDLLRKDVLQKHELDYLNAVDCKFIELCCIVLHGIGKVPLLNRIVFYITTLTENTHFTQTQYRPTVQSHCKVSHHLFSSVCSSVFFQFPVITCKYTVRYSTTKKYFYIHIINYKKRWKNRVLLFYAFTWFSQNKDTEFVLSLIALPKVSPMETNLV